ncbi:sensor histidine kinase [Microcystis aeruginosa]|uniref:histidine kinase n=1 Tax=Microcystis aeruginosa PCC 9443 TaxID=1160281 RepID=I4G503_MICAE|nr:HAMP domain-containing sensor histidine kinase [Microcystis aeruginosa]CCI03014.1 Sensor protein [Microcystis aeruginosa PCC 9443]
MAVFTSIRRRLLLSYLLVLTAILAGFAVAVRFLFFHSLNQELIARLTTLAQGASTSVEGGNRQLIFNPDFPTQSLLVRDQALEWFDSQGRSQLRQGRYTMNLPFVGQGAIQIQIGNPRIQGITLPIIDSDTGQLIGYVRASQSLQEFDEAMRHLDWGMLGGIAIAIGLSGVGGVVLVRQAMQPIECSFTQLKQFTADASHELRSPLMAISSNAQVALRYPDGIRPSDAEKFRLIVSTVKQLTRLTEDLLLLARTDTQPLDHYQPVRLDHLLADVVQLYQPQATAKAITLQYTTTDALYTNGDDAQLRRLFTNLIDNALNYTPAGGSVAVQSQTLDSQLLITVEDNGIGIAPKQLHQVFERFWRAESARNYQSGGSGLGLAIVQAIIQQHQGTISVTSEPGVGSCFRVRLPAYSPTDSIDTRKL